MEYIIKKGKHYSNWFRFPFLRIGRSIKFQFMIESSAHYTLNSEDDFYWNKLFGLSNSWNHHESSARIGWRRLDEERYQICLYTYDDGVKIVSKEMNLFYDTFYSARIFISRNNFYLLFKDSSIIIPRKSEKLFPIKLVLKPFFGGNTVAPKDIKIQINMV